MHTPYGVRGQAMAERAAKRAMMSAWMGDTLTRVQGVLSTYVQAELLARAALAARAGDMPAEELVLTDLSERAQCAAGQQLDPETHERLQELAAAFVVQALATMHPPPPAPRVMRPPIRGRALPVR